MRSALVYVLLLAGCDAVFDIEVVGEEPDGPMCPGLAVGGPQIDDDQDGLANADDNCPLAANVDQHDEDGDGFGDPCDLCPATEENRDADCDGIGDSCDPDSSRADARLFYGFGTANELITSNPPTTRVEVVDDVLRIYTDTPSDFGSAYFTRSVALEGVYETTFTFKAASASSPNYHAVDLRFGADDVAYPQSGYFARVYRFSSDAGLGIGPFNPTSSIPVVETAIASFAPGTYTLRVTVDGGAARAELIGSGGVMGEVDGGMTFPPLAATSRFGVYGGRAAVDFDYVLRTAPAEGL